MPPMTPKTPGPPSRRPLSPFVRDIGLVLVIKFVLLTALWWFFFSQPVVSDPRTEPERVREHVFPVSSDAAIPKDAAHASR